MRKLLFLLLLVSGIASAQYTPTGSKTRWINGVGLSSTRDTSLFTSAADTNIVTTWNGNIYWKGTGYWNKIGHSTNVGAQIHDSLYAVYQLKASTSAGARLVSNSGTVVGEWGLGGSANMDFHGFAGYDANRSASYTARSFTDKNYVDSSNRVKQSTLIYSMGNSETSPGLYQDYLISLLGSQYASINKGIAGNYTIQMLNRFYYDIIYPGDASYVMIQGGINDITAGSTADSIQKNLQAMYTMAHNAGIKVVAITLFPYGSFSSDALKLSRVDSVNTWIMNTATNVDYRVNAFTPLENTGLPKHINPLYVQSDSIHLNQRGDDTVGAVVFRNVTWSVNPTTYNVSVSKNVALDQNLRIADAPSFQALNISASNDRYNNSTDGINFISGSLGSPIWKTYSRTQNLNPSPINNYSIYNFSRAKDDFVIDSATGVLTFGNSFKPDTDNTYDIGKTGTRYRDFEVSRDITSGRYLIAYGTATFYDLAQYNVNKSSLFNNRSLVDKGYVDSSIANNPAIVGTANYVPKFTSSSAIGNSAITDNLGFIGINTTSPTSEFDMRGESRIGITNGSVLITTPNATSTNGVTQTVSYFGSGGYGPYKLDVAGSNALTISTGRVMTWGGQHFTVGTSGNMYSFRYNSNNNIDIFQDNTKYGFYNARGQYDLTINNTTGAADFLTSVSTKHFGGSSSAPSVSTNSVIGTSASIVGTDASGEITFTTTNGSIATGTILTVTFNSAYTSAPYVVFSPSNDKSPNAQPYVYVTNRTTSGFDLAFNATYTVFGTTYKWTYQVIQ